MPQTNFELCTEINTLVGNTVQHSLETAKHREEVLLRHLPRHERLADTTIASHQVFMFGLLEDFSGAVFMGSAEQAELIFDVLPEKTPDEDPVLDRCIRFVIIDRQGTVLMSIHRKLRSLLVD